ncbi:MAG: putative feruloyl esterase B-2 [Alectoria fallacina]|uniref:Carboxylic ester hydrolase n=1 Tax=Alectoria fallacina TaxID=1903189 RepID=A0A8H3FJQ9_9LECA|nr:MAG: putative feruloyl esterase B-2 [Alectoria fallacina]
MPRTSSLVAFLTPWIPLAVHALHNFQDKCLSFTPEASIYNSSRHVLAYVAAGTNLSLPDNDPTCAQASQLVSVNICRVALSIPTTNRSSISFELWLPEDWSHRFLVTGNGGIDGCTKYVDLAYTTQHGFASVGSNNGHNGTTAITMYHNPDVVTDFAWRSLHTITVAGKTLTNLFYDEKYRRSYYLGCSLGGRQGIKAAEMFPGDFDGIVAGSPALDFNNLQSWRASFFPITGPANSSAFISTASWTTLIHDEVLSQCDGLDGVIDGIIEDPNLCSFRPEALLCDKNTSTTCLTSTQVEMVREIFSPFYGEDGDLIYPAMQPGSEILAAENLYAGKPFSYSESWFKYVVYDPSWNAATFNIHDAAVAEALNPSNIRTWPDNLSAFQKNGGKVLLFHGGQDNQITSFDTERFYNFFSRATQTTSDELDNFLRFFRVPGMFHCNSGPGGWVIGQGGGASAKGVPFESANNVLAAVVQWVENGTAVKDIVGTKFVNDSVDLGVDFQHRHCK